jgi:signal transduction histidine kinase
MLRRRDLLIMASAIAVMAAIAALIIVTVLDAQQRGRRVVERQKVQQIEQLAGSMNARIQSAYDGLVSFANPRQGFTLRPGDPADAALIAPLQSSTSRTGIVLINADRQIVNGTSLLDPERIGTRLERGGLSEALSEGASAILPVAPGVTSANATLAFVSPIYGAQAEVRGAVVFESEVSADSDFNEEVAALGGQDSGEVFFLDAAGVVVASTATDTIGKPIDDMSLVDRQEGLRRADGTVSVVSDVDAARWRAVFRQSASAFDGGLTQRLQTAVLLIVIAGIIVGVITVLALANRLRAAREEQRRLSEINAAREEFISIVSHELRTPVAGVLGFLQTTLDHWDQLDDTERRETIDRATVNARRLQALTRDVLDVTSIEQGQIRYAFGPVDLREEVEAATLSMRDLQPERNIVLTAVDGPVWVHADGDRLLQVLGNLFDNAVTSSPPGSDITVTLSSRDGEAVVSVVDRGSGLAEGEEDTVFQKFVRGRASGIRGTGLGLYLSREMITAHGGRIWAETSTTGGATFSFALPLMVQEGGENAARDADARSGVADSTP